jgi:flagellin FlaB
MRKLSKILKAQDLGDMGIGAMIVFIAMVLVAGIAASVLIQTANRLEIQAMKTGQETTNEVATGIGVDAVTGQKGSLRYGTTWVNSTILNVTITISPRSGSKDVDLSKTVIEISDSTNKILMAWNSSCLFAHPNSAGVFRTSGFNGTARQFGIIVLEDADSSCTGTNPVINRGDHVLLTLSVGRAFSGLAVRTNIWGMVIPEHGAPGIFAFRTPPSYFDTIYELY